MQRPFKTVCVSGYFDPLHVGHIAYLKNAKLIGDRLIVILNTDAQSKRKLRMPQAERQIILESLRYVDAVVLSVDQDENVSQTLKMLRPTVFAKGLSASADEIQACRECEIEIVTNVGSQLHLADLLHQFY